MKFRRKNVFWALGCIAIWALMILYLFQNKPHHRRLFSIGDDPDPDQDFVVPDSPSKGERSALVMTQLDKLESSVQEQLQANRDLMSRLKVLEQDMGKGFVSNGSDGDQEKIAVLIFACNRRTVKRNLDQLIRYRPVNQTHRLPLIVSQDCGHEPTRKVIESYGSQVTLIQQPDLSDFPLTGKDKKFKGYYKIARHYKWALNHTFTRYSSVIIVEDDLDISPDFFEYFLALHPILRADPTLWCISAWNDNGKEALVSNNPESLFRSDFFPGLGWMLTRDVWSELYPKWPKAFWDDWIRQPNQRKGRSCIRPEISRSKTFGKFGVSNGLFYEKHLKYIKLNDQFVPFTRKDLSYLIKQNYDASFLKIVYTSPVLTVPDLVTGNYQAGDASIRIIYRNKDQFKKIAKTLGLMDDFKSGVPRTGYLGIVSFIYRKKRIFLAPPSDWKGYDLTWT